MSRTQPSYDYQIKVLLIGDSGVGKTSLLMKFSDGSFTSSHITTIGIDFKVKTIDVGDKKVKIQCWDTAGQERFRTITTAYYRGSHAIILVYDVTDESTFQNVSHWVKTIHDHASKDVVMVLVGNKTDLEDQKIVSTQQGQELATSYGMDFYETSAKSSLSINQIFYHIAAKIIETLKVKPNVSVGPIILAPQPVIPKKKCC